MKSDRRNHRRLPRKAQVRHLRRKHGLSENAARLIAELHYGVTP